MKSILLLSSLSFAAQSASLVYNEIDLGGGLWQYDYTFYNDSTANEYLYSVDLFFAQWATINGSPLPQGWDSTIWEGPNYTDYIVTFSSSPGSDIAAGDSLDGFSFTIDYRAESIGYNAYFDNHQGGMLSESGISVASTTVVPEPLSYILFLMGGVSFAVRFYWRKNIT